MCKAANQVTKISFHPHQISCVRNVWSLYLWLSFIYKPLLLGCKLFAVHDTELQLFSQVTSTNTFRYFCQYQESIALKLSA